MSAPLLVICNGRGYRVECRGRILAWCPTYDAAMAARRLLAGAS